MQKNKSIYLSTENDAGILEVFLSEIFLHFDALA